MPRIARIAPTGYVYHVLTRGNNRQDIFLENADFVRYREVLGYYKEKYSFLLYHYVLMSNHVHLVLETAATGFLSDIMKGINLSYAQYYKKRYGHIGHFWQDRYKSIMISKDEYLLACGSYVELNPVRAEMVKTPGDYRWSSYSFYAFSKSDLLVDVQPVYHGLSKDENERRRLYRSFVREMLRDKDCMRGEMTGRRIYGSGSFKNNIRDTYEIDAEIKPKGRPRKAPDIIK